MIRCQKERPRGGFSKAHLSNVIPFFIRDLAAAPWRMLIKRAGLGWKELQTSWRTGLEPKISLKRIICY